METGKMELNQEQMEQVAGSLVCNDAAPAPREGCKHPNKVKTPWWGREYDYIFGHSIRMHTFARIAER